MNAREAFRGQTALMWAAAENHAAVVQAADRAAGADVNARSIALRVSEADRRQRRHHPRPVRGRPHGDLLRRPAGRDRDGRAPDRGGRRSERRPSRSTASRRCRPRSSTATTISRRGWSTKGADVNDGSLYTAIEMRNLATLQQPAEPARHRQRREQPRPHQDAARARRRPEPRLHEEDSAAAGAGRHQRPAGRHAAVSRHESHRPGGDSRCCSTRAPTRTWRSRTARRR